MERLASDIILYPVVSEKSVMGKEFNKYSFRVIRDANKVEIKKAVEELFKVKVVRVNTMKCHPKLKRMGAHAGYTSEWKKAIVTLKEGEKIAFFEGM
ncbi:MAG: 50S ribosomal protein L23 [Candidatus Wallbacteria bacterium GWC2_49_35]|jgi:large subunit ribosomal protein L23|uniref:Large ribosomal subunit protein uL23 n=1 Tax=Candidatus Wallbacteria bacterium GWC2_49_35 TaxID=1817813 RepID=A0A1F7WW50_9BACT|nr:MAG: 50S ribosomal protein L23 [Candidatus Wallbacteria bacterium GWC2_49_35]HBC75281.1 50S ribosomal protein L23 [Candidatus Wallbacteria bacterium]